MHTLDKTNGNMVSFQKQETLRKAFCNNHNDKMYSLTSLSTCCLDNERCEARRKNGNSICSHCYSFTMQKRFKNLREKLKRNTHFLTTVMLEADDIPFVPNDMLRFESFGDLINTTQVWNYFLIAEKNKHCRCALWTKNPDIIDAAIREFEITKPDNLTIVYSSPELNRPHNVDWWFVDKVFTVYDKKHKDNVKINCGARSCRSCGKCYSNNNDRFINEVLK